MRTNARRLSSSTPSPMLFLNALPRFTRASTVAVYILFALALPSFAAVQHMELKQDAANEGRQILNARRNGWVEVPGQLVRPDCVHEVPLGADVDVKGDVEVAGSLVAHYDPCPEAPIKMRQPHSLQASSPLPGIGDSWAEDIQWQAPLAGNDNIDQLNSYWNVPKNPTQNGGVIFLFNGIEPDAHDWLFQPVLQYGYNGVNSWQIGAWLVGSNGYVFHSPFVGVSPGDLILGVTWMTSQSANTLHYEVDISDRTSGADAWITGHSTGLHWTWAYAGVLEAHNVGSCTQLPNIFGIGFTSASVYHGYPTFIYDPAGWVGNINFSYGGPECNFFTTTSSDGGSLSWIPY